MKRKILCLFLTIIMLYSTFVMLSIPCFASSTTSYAYRDRVIDNANLLTVQEERNLTERLNKISEQNQADVVVLTVYSLNGKTPMAYADDYYDYNGYGYGPDFDGILLLVSMEYSDWYISTTGFCIEAVHDDALKYMSDKFCPSLSSGNFENAFLIYAEYADYFIGNARDGHIVSEIELKNTNDYIETGLIALIFGLVAATFVVFGLKSQLKSVKKSDYANEYIVNGSLNITNRKDSFIYNRVSKTLKQSNNSSSGGGTHRSSSGRSHGGRGGKF